jgi:hypothetical protein
LRVAAPTSTALTVAMSERDQALAARAVELAQRGALLQRKDREIALRGARSRRSTSSWHA